MRIRFAVFSVVVLLASLLLSLGCDDNKADKYPLPEGSLQATLTGIWGSESLSLEAPPGKIYVSIDDWGNRCDFSVGVYDNKDEFHLFVRLDEDQIPELMAGGSQDATAYAGFFFLSDSVVRIRVEHDEGEDDLWYSGGGRVHVEALPVPGEPIRVTFHDVQMVGHSGVAEDSLLNGEIEATYRGAVIHDWAGTWDGSRACPEIPSPAD